jgi:hypothetical protein
MRPGLDKKARIRHCRSYYRECVYPYKYIFIIRVRAIIGAFEPVLGRNPRMGKKLLYPFGIVVATILFGFYQRLPAAMPPHFYDSIPEYGGNLLGETVWLLYCSQGCIGWTS